MKEIKSIEEIINDYDNFIIDQWGVMHDGTFGYDHAFNSINILNSNDKNLFIISNSSKRSKSSIKSIFDEIKGIGPKRKKELLLHFGTIEKIKSASLEELKKIKSIPAKKLQELFEFFNG